MPPIPFIGLGTDAVSVNVDSEACFNVYPEMENPESKNVVILRGAPGLKSPLASPTTPGYGRGMHVPSIYERNKAYFVAGLNVYKTTTGGIVTLVGTLTAHSNDPVHFADNGIGQECLLVDGTDVWLIDMENDTMSKQTVQFLNTVDSENQTPSPSWCTWQDGYFLIHDKNSFFAQWSASYDGTTWGTTDTIAAEGVGDNINAIISHNREIWLFGPRSYEIFYNSTVGTDTTFDRIPGTLRDIGLLAPHSLARNNNNLFFLGGADNGYGKVFRSEGYQTIPISTPSLETEIQRYRRLDNAIGFCYQQEGHSFYWLNFPSQNKTWVYDLTTGVWHQRSYLKEGLNLRHRGAHQMFFNDKNYVQDWETGDIYELDERTYDDNGAEMERIITLPHINNDRKRMIFNGFELDMESGVGLKTGQGSDPQAMLQTSKDGGHTFSGEKWKDIGKIGKYRTRVKWHRLGMARDKVFRVKISDPIKVIIINAHVDVETLED